MIVIKRNLRRWLGASIERETVDPVKTLFQIVMTLLVFAVPVAFFLPFGKTGKYTWSEEAAMAYMTIMFGSMGGLVLTMVWSM